MTAGERQTQVLLVSRHDTVTRDLAAATVGWMCRERGAAFDAYYAAERAGGLFSHHGSPVLGGRHHCAVAQALSRRRTTVLRLGTVSALAPVLRAAARVLDHPADPDALGRAYHTIADELGVAWPETAVAVQTAGLPQGLAHGVAQYAFPEVTQRRALGVPLELSGPGIAALAATGIRRVLTVATVEAAAACRSRWAEAGLSVAAAEEILDADTYLSLTFRIAERWLETAGGIDMCEPLTASYWLPYCVREGRLQVTGDQMRETTERLAPLLRRLREAGRGDGIVHGRWGGGAIGRARSDEDLFPLYEDANAFQVIEPCRPVLSVLSAQPPPLPQPPASPWDLEPTDAELARWARERKVLATYVTHSGELSHDDAIVYTIDLAAATGAKLGVGVHAQRYAFDPDAVELLQVPVDEGGALGLCEPVLHSSGLGIMVESLAAPAAVAGRMREARDRIAALAGSRFAPRGVYCFCDAVPGRWRAPQTALWLAIRDAGFEYVISSVGHGEPALLFRAGDFVVLNQVGFRRYPYSPFVRVETPAQLGAAESSLDADRSAGWLVGALDIPLYGYTPALSFPNPRFGGVRLADFVAYVRKGGERGNVVSATPRTVARYARLLDDLRRTGSSPADAAEERDARRMGLR